MPRQRSTFSPDVKVPAALRKISSGRNDLGDEQTRRLEHKEMSAASKIATVRSRIRGELREADPLISWGRPMTRRKKQVNALRGTAVARDQASEEGFAEITSGRSRWQQGLVATCEDFLYEANSRGKKSQMGLANESVRATIGE